MRFSYLLGAADLRFDFSARTVSGTLHLETRELGFEESFGTVTFTGVIGAPGETTFSGTISAPRFAQAGSFEGRFTGPDASEIILRWRTPLEIPSANRNTQAFGVLAGRRVGGTLPP